ncbi:hypothetical protein FRC05_007482 [Tulasnella sp. 425]|nr:hypothetical protein FRC05_007482 [Tulasnella sp. 425]
MGVIKQDHQAQKREQGDTAATDPGREISVPEDPSNWDENQDATILRVTRNHPDEVQAALIWIRDALALYHDSATVEQAQSLLQLHAEWRGSVSKTTPWIETYLIPSQLRQTRSLRDRVMELKWGIASNQDTTLHLEKERRVQYVRRQQEMAEATSELLDSPPSPTQWEFREIGTDADGSQAFQETTSSNSE